MIDHLWQSTFFGLAAWLLTLALRRQRASVRYAIWFAASGKFLLPFAPLIALGGHLPGRSAAPEISTVLGAIGQPFLASPSWPVSTAAPAASHGPMVLLTLWLAGIAAGLCCWLRTILRMRGLARAATPLDLALPIPVRASREPIEPGVFGIFRPVLLLPAGLAERLTPEEFSAVVAHELCHVRRRDNLTAAIHMMVETVFWFHPLVWWIRARLVAERERACDEAVLARSSDPHTYAEALLRICRLSLESPPLCSSGISGGDLQRRIAGIVHHAAARRLNAAQKSLLVLAAAAAIAGPLAVGSNQKAEFEVASVKLHEGADDGHYEVELLPGGKVSVRNLPLNQIVALAWHVRWNLISGAPGWFESDRYDIVAKAPPKASEDEMRLMMQALLVERFGLTAHSEIREQAGYAMTVAKTGLRLGKPDRERRADEGCEPKVVTGKPGERNYECYVSMEKLAEALPFLAKGYFDRPVVDQTGLSGFYRVKLNWTGANQIDVVGGQTVFESVEQLGLKLERQKVPLPALVVDGINRTPTGN